MASRITTYLRSNVLGLIAIFIALGAGAYAAGLPKDSVKSKQIKAGAVKKAELADNAITSPKVDDGSLLGEDFAVGELPSGPEGPVGPQGETGSQGAPGISGLELVSDATANNSESPKSIVVNCPPGKIPLSGGADINGGTTGSSPDNFTDVAVTHTGAPSDPNTVPGSFFARAHEEEVHTGNWNLQVRVLCASVNP